MTERQRSLFRGNYQRGPDRGRPMREVLYPGTCRGCGGNKHGICIFTGLLVRDRDTCRAPIPPRRKRKRPKGAKGVRRTVSFQVMRTDVADLITLRRSLGLNGKQLASLIGISHSYLRDLESGLKAGSVRTFVRWILELDKAKARGLK